MLSMQMIVGDLRIYEPPREEAEPSRALATEAEEVLTTEDDEPIELED